MSEFQKTIIVDLDHAEEKYHYRQTIKAAVVDLGSDGGVVIVERGTYTLNGTGNQTTVEIPSNTTIIGRGDVTINVTSPDISVFTNTEPTNGNSRINISGFKIVVNCTSNSYGDQNDVSLIDMKRVSDSVIEKITVSVDQNSRGVYISQERKPAAIRFIGQDADHIFGGNVISQCHIENFGALYNGSYNYGFGIHLSTYCQKNMINNNYIRACCTCCFIQNNSNHNVFSNNILCESADVAAGDYYRDRIVGHCGLLVGCDYTNIIGNQIHNNTEHGIYLSTSKRCVVKGNIITENQVDGIKMYLNVIHTEKNTIVGNICYGNGTGEFQGECSGIVLYAGSDYNNVFGNECISNYRMGINEVNSANPVPEKNEFIGNLCRLNQFGVDIYVVGTSSDCDHNITG